MNFLKRHKKAIFINIILTVLFLIILDVIFYFKQSEIENIPINEYKFFNIPVDYNDMNASPYDSGSEYNKTIILIGCSFSYSYGLKYEDSLAYKLTQYSKRHVYVDGRCSNGPNETLYIFGNENIYKQVQEPEYIIYLFIENHFSRINSRIYSCVIPNIRPMYEIDENYNYKEKKCWYKWIFLSHLYKYYYLKKYTFNYGVREEEKFFKTMMALKKQINKHWPSTKLVILRYDEANIEAPFIFSEEYINKFKDNGIIYLDADEIVFGSTGERMIGEKYMQKDQHPSAYAFDLLAKKLAEKFLN